MQDVSAFARDAFPSNTTRILFFTVPLDVNPRAAELAAIAIMGTARGDRRDILVSAFALGGAQAVADLVLGEQRERQPAQRVLPA
jgi:hypothetical protein